MILTFFFPLPGRRLATTVALLLLTLPAYAHEGPPFPILVDQHVGSMLVSIWADPDIGTGTFFVVLEPVEKGGTLPDDLSIKIGVTPVSGRLDEVFYEAAPQRVRHGARYLAEVHFDQGEWWDVRIVLDGSEGGELYTRVEATPDGTIGPISLIVYLLPFLAVGFLWLKAVLRRRDLAS